MLSVVSYAILNLLDDLIGNNLEILKIKIYLTDSHNNLNEKQELKNKSVHINVLTDALESNKEIKETNHPNYSY